MAKKNNVQNFVPEQEIVQEEVAPQQEEVLFESEAYGNAQPDAGMGTTVCKPMGIGGPIPVVAPKNNTIQLQPIIVPMAVVPYMSQDNDVLKTEGVQVVEEYDTAASDFSRMEAEQKVEKKKKSRKAGSRAAAFFLFLFSALVVTIYMLAYFKPEVLSLNFAEFNVIGEIVDWAKGTEPVNMAVTILHAICFGFAGITTIIALISLIVGKLPASLLSVFTLLAGATVDAALIYTAVKASQQGAEFVAKEYLEYILLASFATVAFIIAVISAVCLNRNKDIYEDSDFGSQNLI